MAGAGRRESPTVVDELFAEPHRFDFFQAVRLLENWARTRASEDAESLARPVGGDSPPAHEVVRFRTLNSQTFPPSSIASLNRAPEPDDSEQPRPLAEMTVAFMGLTGPNGALPQHYTRLVMERSNRNPKDHTLQNFFDLFNHRAISLFFRAWEKYRFQFDYERAHRDPNRQTTDSFTDDLYCLVGLGTAGLRNRMSVADELVLFYSGHFSHGQRPAISLESLLGEHFGTAARIDQFRGRWLYLGADVVSVMPGKRYPEGLNCRLGKGMIIGNKVWDVQSSFRIVLGPVTYRQFLTFIPSGAALRALWDLVRLYVGIEFRFDVQVILKAEEVPYCRVGGSRDAPSRLGWNTWLKSRPVENDVDDAVFQLHEAR